MANILIVDDMMPIRRSLSSILETAKHNTTHAENGAQAIHLLITQKFDLVITDILMPHSDGLEVLNHIAGMNPHERPPVIAISGGNISMSADHALMITQGKCSAIMKKPVENNILVNTVGRLLKASHVA